MAGLMESRRRYKLSSLLITAVLANNFLAVFSLSTSVLVDADQGEKEAPVSADCTSWKVCGGKPEGGDNNAMQNDSPSSSASPPATQKDGSRATETTHLSTSTASPSTTSKETGASASGASTTTTAQPPAKINKPAKKSRPSDAALAPASQYHYYGGSQTEQERRRRNIRLYPAPMKRNSYGDTSRLKRSVRLSPKEMLALLSLWDGPLPVPIGGGAEDGDDEATINYGPLTDSSRRRFFKQEDVEPELMLSDDNDDDMAQNGIERGRDSWGDEATATGRRYYLFPADYRNEARRKRNSNRQRQQQLEARKEIQRLVQEVDQLRQLIRQDREEQARVRGEWGPQEYKRRVSVGTARYTPEETNYYRWLQAQ